MKVRVPLMIQDPATSEAKMLRLDEGFDITREAFFLDGPVTRRVAVLDFDDATGKLRNGAKFLPPSGRAKTGKYQVTKGDIYSDAFMQVSVFATVLKTMYLFEDEQTLGRDLLWSFDAPQLLVVPRAGLLPNAFYERESHSLQFFYIPSPRDPDATIFTCLSRDVVAHETGHAILDGIAPDLYNNLTPQSVALHEAIADLTALLMAFYSHNLRVAVLKQTNGSIKDTTAFSSIAEEFGAALDPGGRARSLRPLLNNKSLDPDDGSLDEAGNANFVNTSEPHALSEVLSGALYSVMVRMHDAEKERLVKQTHWSDFKASGPALIFAAQLFKAMVFRALDYLPPGEVSFADFGRALIAADRVIYPEDETRRDWIREQFVQRKIVPDAESLESDMSLRSLSLEDLALAALVESDWAAYEFANRNRDFLRIPEDIHFRVRPRLDVTKVSYHDGEQKIHECLFKVSWDHKEDNQTGYGLPAQRQITMGTTLAINWDTKTVNARLTSDQGVQQYRQRDEMLRNLLDDGLLKVGADAMGPDGKWLCGSIRAETMDGLMRVRATARMLHIAQGDGG